MSMTVAHKPFRIQLYDMTGCRKELLTFNSVFECHWCASSLCLSVPLSCVCVCVFLFLHVLARAHLLALPTARQV